MGSETTLFDYVRITCFLCGGILVTAIIIATGIGSAVNKLEQIHRLLSLAARKQKEEELDWGAALRGRRSCPSCGEPVRDEAIRCPKCRTEIPQG